MTKLISAEALKLRTTRSFYVTALASLALIAIGALAIAATSTFHTGDHPGRDTLSIAGNAETFALVLGVLAITTEFRHGTITPALLIAPRRTPLLSAKFVVLVVSGLVFGLLAFGGAAAIALPILASRHIATHLDAGQVAGIVAGGALATSLFAAIGLAVGALVRNQVGAIVGSLAVLFAVEPLLMLIPAIKDGLQKFGLDGLASGAAGTTPLHSQIAILGHVPASLVLAGYALMLSIGAAALLRRRDVIC
jgi:ABC-2 type transport system permease protein